MTRLGCSSLEAIITSQCGAPRLCQLNNASRIFWSRKLDDVSEAQVVIPIDGGLDIICCNCLGLSEPWCHELHIFRDAEFVWGGPVKKVTYGYEKVVIDAQDVLAWADVRISEAAIDYTSTGAGPADISVIAATVLDVAFAEHDPCILEFVLVNPTSFTDTQIFFPAFEQTALEQLNDLAGIGLDYTVVGRRIILGGEELPIQPLLVLNDEMIIGEIEVSKDGDLAGNRFFVRYQNDDDPGECASHIPPATPPCPAIAEGNQECYGAIERLRNDGVPFDLATAQQAADAYLTASRIVPRTIEFPPGTRLHPDTPIDVNQLIPGQRIDVALNNLCIDVQQSFRLLEVQGEQEGLGEETVSISLGPINLLNNQ